MKIYNNMTHQEGLALFDDITSKLTAQGKNTLDNYITECALAGFIVKIEKPLFSRLDDTRLVATITFPKHLTIIDDNNNMGAVARIKLNTDNSIDKILRYL